MNGFIWPEGARATQDFFDVFGEEGHFSDVSKVFFPFRFSESALWDFWGRFEFVGFTDDLNDEVLEFIGGEDDSFIDVVGTEGMDAKDHGLAPLFDPDGAAALPSHGVDEVFEGFIVNGFDFVAHAPHLVKVFVSGVAGDVDGFFGKEGCVGGEEPSPAGHFADGCVEEEEGDVVFGVAFGNVGFVEVGFGDFCAFEGGGKPVSGGVEGDGLGPGVGIGVVNIVAAGEEVVGANHGAGASVISV